jgi:hypothetical protein
VLVFQRDLGSSLLFFGVFVVLLYVATERPSWLVYGVVLFFGGAYFAYTQFGHVRDRVTIWLDAFGSLSRGAPSTWTRATRSSSPCTASQRAGWSAPADRGPPEFVPFAKSDFIMSTLGEELGLTGLMAVLLLYAIIVERGLRAALIVRDGFGKLLATGWRPAWRCSCSSWWAASPPHPADRPHHPVHVGGRLLADRELGARRAAAAHQRRGPPTRRLRSSPLPPTRRPRS